jgi:ribose-phosphate pyrophosphokinase
MTNLTYFFAGSASQLLGENMAILANASLGKWYLWQFSDGEIRPILQEKLNGATVVIIQSTYPPAKHILELLLLIDAAKNAGAQKVIVVTLYLGYMRQDRIHQAGEPHGAVLKCKLLSAAGADELIVCHPHTQNLNLFFKGPIKQISSAPVFVNYLENLQLNNMCFVAPDSGAVAEAQSYACYFNARLIKCHKIRHQPNQVKKVKIMGNIENANAIIIDDIVDTGNTLCAVAHQLKKEGARSVRALCTHPILSGNAYDLLDNSHLEEIVVTNTIPLKYETKKIKVLDIAPLIVKAINQ